MMMMGSNKKDDDNNANNAGVVVEDKKKRTAALGSSLAELGPSWVLSFDQTTISLSLVTKDWTAAMSILHQIDQLVVEKNTINNNNDRNQNSHYYPDLHLTNGSTVRIVLPVSCLELAKAIDVLMFPLLALDEQQQQQQRPTTAADDADTTTTTSTTGTGGDDDEQAVPFDQSHFPNGLNGDFFQPNAIEKFGSTGGGGGGGSGGGDDTAAAATNTDTTTTTTLGIFENPELRDIARAKHNIVRALRLQPGDVVADIGAGTGLLEPLLSEAVGPTGQVIVSEISAPFRRYMEERLCRGDDSHDNILILDDPTERDPKLPVAKDDENAGVAGAGMIDLVLMVDVYHHLEYPQSVLRRVRESLRDRTGALVVIDFHRDPDRIASHDANWVYQHLRADQATFTQEIERTGFVRIDQLDVPGLPENYCLVFRKCPLRLSEPGVGWT